MTKKCPSCGTRRYMEFECVECCLKWLRGMDKETMVYNAPMIERIAGKEQLEKVRSEWTRRGYKPKESNDDLPVDEKVRRFLSNLGRSNK